MKRKFLFMAYGSIQEAIPKESVEMKEISEERIEYFYLRIDDV